MKKYTRQEQRLLAKWAADCALRVLWLFEIAHPSDGRPRKAIRACRAWVRTGVFKMSDIRRASLDSHAAARQARGNDAATYAARAAGHSVATAHVPQHAMGSAYYALKAIAAADPERAKTKIARERGWQTNRLPKEPRAEIFRIKVIEERNGRISIKLDKSGDF